MLSGMECSLDGSFAFTKDTWILWSRETMGKGVINKDGTEFCVYSGSV